MTADKIYMDLYNDISVVPFKKNAVLDTLLHLNQHIQDPSPIFSA